MKKQKKPKLNFDNIWWFLGSSWSYVTTNHWKSKLDFFIGLPRAFYKFFYEEL